MTSGEPPQGLDAEEVEETLAPATPGAEALPTSDDSDASEKPRGSDPAH